MDGSTGMTMDVTKTRVNLTKITEQMASVNQGNFEAIMNSGRAWVVGNQAIPETMASTIQTHLDQTMSAWKALTTAKSLTTTKSLTGAMDLQTNSTQVFFQTVFANAGRHTGATLRLA